MKNYPINDDEVIIVRELCAKHNLEFKTEPTLLPGMLWLSIHHADGLDLSPELWFCLGRAFEVKARLKAIDESAQNLYRGNVRSEELIDELP